ncbi:zinc ABC transporter substrate-binding protein [Lutibacter sp. B2]|nr:zinc ABC transporter substrate-binding protein [Lutibacter sp. B2]
MIIMIITISGCESKKLDNSNREKKITVAVSIVPQENFVRAVSGDLVNIITMIPPGNSPANYQPTPKQMIEFSESKVYFSMGVPTEEANILPKVEDLNKDIKVVSLADKVGEVYPHRTFSEEAHDHSGRDPHIWLSPKRVKVMIKVIKDELILLDPNNKSTYEKNADEYIAKLDEVDHEIKDTLNGFNQQSFIIYHPVLGYFADDYGLKMMAIEEDGKETTVKKLQEVIDLAKKENIKFVFYQQEFDSKQAETIAKEIRGATVKVAPLAPNYIENLKSIANTFKDVLK